MVDRTRTGWRALASVPVLVLAACGTEAGVATIGAQPLPTDPGVAAPSTAPTLPITDDRTMTSDTSPATSAPSSPAPERRQTRSLPAWLCALVLSAAACESGDAIPSTTPVTEPAVCTVSELLVPTCGAWFGVSSPSTDGAFDYTRGLAEYESLVGHPPDILRFYQRDDDSFPNAEHRALAERPGQPRSILHFSWKPAIGQTWRQIADGEFDDHIDVVAGSLSAYPHTMFLTIHHEPENDVVPREGSGMTTRDYVDMYRHVVEQLRARGVDNVVYVMNYIGFVRWADMIDELYPGDDVVDWIAWDPYGLDGHRSIAEVINDPRGDWPGFYEWATERAPGMPLMLGEWGFDLPSQPWAADAVSELPEVLRTRFPAIKAVVYWNDRSEQFDSRIGVDTESVTRFADEFAEIASDPYFDRVSTDDVP